MHKRRRIWTSFLLISILVTGIWLIYGHLSPEFTSKRPSIIFIPKTIDYSVEFWQVMDQGVRAAAKDFGMDVEVMGTPNEVAVQQQISLLNEAIQKKPDVIILAATDYNALIPASKHVVESGIKLITVDSGIREQIAASFIGTNNYEAGRKSARELRNHLGDQGKIAVISFVKGSATSLQREQGVRDDLKENGHYTVLDTLYSEGSVVKAYDLTLAMLNKESNLNGIVALNEPSTLGAGRAILALGRQASVKLVGFDSSNGEIQLIDKDILQATVIQRPFNMGYLAVKTASEVLSGVKVQKTIDTGSKMITKYNMYNQENQKLLFPFVEPKDTDQP